MTATIDKLTELAQRASDHPHEIGETDIRALADFALERSTLADHFREEVAKLHDELDATYQPPKPATVFIPGYITVAERRFLDRHIADPTVRQRTIAFIIESRAAIDILTLVMRGACTPSIHAESGELVFIAGERDVPAIAEHIEQGGASDSPSRSADR